jgi:hypothetical protein
MEFTSPSNKCAKLLMSSRNHNLTHILLNEYNWKYKLSVWEELRPLNIRKIDYGESDPIFLIKRKGISRSELRLLCSWHEKRIKTQLNNSNN